MKKMLMSGLVTITFLSACTDNEQVDPATDNEESVEENAVDTDDLEQDEEENGLEVVADHLEIPWSIDYFEDTIYLTERPGTIVALTDGESERQELELEEDISTASEAGLLGFVISPTYSETGEAFVYYTYESSEGQFNRIVRVVLEDTIWRETEVLLDQIPSGSVHHGGRLLIGPDEHLYATTGDAALPELAQDLTSLGGKILRLNLDGSVPEDNPFTDSYVYSYGHRNPQGLAWDTDGTLYSSEHGDRANDEINLIEAGQNYGWPVIEGEEEQEDMVSPLFTSGPDHTWAPSGMDYHEDKLYVSGLRGNAVLEFDLETNEERELFTGFGRIRDVYIDGEFLYFISNNTDGRGNPEDDDDKLYRISLSEL
ncbi:MAG: PQQ-dependent sugar dehydrogenase [Alkalibacterium sp.]|nr:PQQ-dependent sugar dehydrogenase [Alkalibacterium sp.]